MASRLGEVSFSHRPRFGVFWFDHYFLAVLPRSFSQGYQPTVCRERPPPPSVSPRHVTQHSWLEVQEGVACPVLVLMSILVPPFSCSVSVVCGVPRPQHSRAAPKQDAAPRHHGPDPVLIALSPLVRGVWAQAGKQLRCPRAAGSGDPQRWVGRGTAPDPAPQRQHPSRGDRQRPGSGVQTPQALREIQAQFLRAASQQSGGGAGPRHQAAPNPAEVVGIGPAVRQLPDRAEGSNSVRNEAAASGGGPGQLGGRHLTWEE
ncbi:hypothetical protein NDU88_004546 [Pleurodeles waltl]|uniref:Uncharacterized protein n=1 Tax=Pleurodeles waltl TaxID=8319 RepID=A0AAV7WS66_PLEWA|nr:hypothetical protein NDU88_004546 [Pleurodeles waltl]